MSVPQSSSDKLWYQPGSDAFPLVIATLLILAVTPLFWLFPLDLMVQDYYFSQDGDKKWPSAELPFWKFFYQASWILAGLFAVVGTVLGIAASKKARLQPWGTRGWCLMLVVILGAGLIANVIFKDHYGRYRPRQIENYGGNYQYQPPLVMGEQGAGKSFPCGHATAGFAFYIFYFFWRRRHQKWALAALGWASLLGLTFGFGRAAAGAHFLSDTLWAGYFMFLTSWLVYYPIMRVPQKEARYESGFVSPPMTTQSKVVIGLGITAVIAGALMAKPYYKDVDMAPSESELAGVDQFNLRFDDATLKLALDESIATLDVELKTRGFGFPGNKLKSKLEKGETVWSYSYRHEGYFSEKGTNAVILVNPEWLDNLSIHLESGKLFVGDNLQSDDLSFTGAGQLVTKGSTPERSKE